LAIAARRAEDEVLCIGDYITDTLDGIFDDLGNSGDRLTNRVDGVAQTD
jgi:hypothetical protein